MELVSACSDGEYGDVGVGPKTFRKKRHIAIGWIDSSRSSIDEKRCFRSQERLQVEEVCRDYGHPP